MRSASEGLVGLLVVALLAGCGDDAERCPWSGGQVPEGRLAHSRGAWLPGMRDQTLTFDYGYNTQYATLEFEKGGVRYRATYRLQQLNKSPVTGTWVTIVGVQQPDDCEAAFAQAAVVDAVLLKRDGKVIARAAEQQLVGGCQDGVKPEQVLGDPDGQGVSLAGAALRVRFEKYLPVSAGDEIVVHATGGYYEVRVEVLQHDGRHYDGRIGGGKGTRGWLLGR